MAVSASINYTARQGDTFDSLSLQVYSTEKKAHLLIEANPDYADVIIFSGGEVLKIPLYRDSRGAETLAPWRRGS